MDGGVLSTVNSNDRSIVGLLMLAHGMVHTYELSIPILVAIWLVEFPVSTAALGAVVSIGYALLRKRVPAVVDWLTRTTRRQRG